MTHGSGVQAYAQTQVSTTTNQKQLIVMAYDGILKFLNRAVNAMAARQIEDAHNDLVRARAIVEELASTLNMEEGGIVARNLWNLYVFFMQKITEANLTKDPTYIEGILPSIKELRDGWNGMEVPEDDLRAQALNRRVPEAETATGPSRLSITG